MGGATGTRVRGDGAVVPFVMRGACCEYGDSKACGAGSGGGGGGGGWGVLSGLVLAPAQVSRRST